MFILDKLPRLQYFVREVLTDYLPGHHGEPQAELGLSLGKDQNG
jgi:hypothetical protein